VSDWRRGRASRGLANRLLAAGMVAAVLAGCGASPGTDLAASASSGPTLQSLTPADLASEDAFSAPPADPGASPTLPRPTSGSGAPQSAHGFPELEALLPISVGGVATVRMSGRGDLYGGGDFCLSLVCGTEVSDLAAALRVGTDSVEVAQAILPGSGPLVGVVAIRVPSYTGQDILTARLELETTRAHFPMTIADRSVTWAFYCSGTTINCADYLYAHDDVMFVVKATSSWPQGPLPSPVPSQVETAFTLLP